MNKHLIAKVFPGIMMSIVVHLFLEFYVYLVLLESYAFNTTWLGKQDKHRDQGVRHFVFILRSHIKLQLLYRWLGVWEYTLRTETS